MTAGPERQEDQRAPRWLLHLGAVGWFVALAIAATYPLVTVLDTHITGAGPGDHLAFLWNDWWTRTVVQSGNWSRLFHTDALFAPFGAPLILNTHTALESLLSATVLGGLPVIRAHNLLVLAGMAGNGLASYALALAVTRRIPAALFAGTAFATSSFISLHLLGHINLVHAWVLPLAAWSWIKFLERPSPTRAALLGFAYAVTLWSDYYYFVYAALFAASWLLLRWRDVSLEWRPARRPSVDRLLAGAAALTLLAGIAISASGGIVFEVGSLHVSALHARNPMSIAGVLGLIWLLTRGRVVTGLPDDAPAWRAIGINGALAGALFALLAAPIVYAAAGLAGSGDYVSQQYFWRSAPRGVDLVTVVAGPPLHGVTGGLTTALDERLHVDRVEQTGWLGIVLGALVATTFGARRAWRVEDRRWAMILAVFLLWALGPSLSVGGLDTGILLPQTLARYVPIVANARIPGRAFVMVQLTAATLAALLIVRRQWTMRTVLSVTIVVMLESLPAPFPLYRVPPGDAVDVQLAQGSGAVIELPSGLRDGFGEDGRFDSRALAHQLAHRRPLAGGFAARIPPRLNAAYRSTPAFAALFDVSAGRVPIAALPADLGVSLAAAGISDLVVNTDEVGSAREALAGTGLRFVTADSSRELYTVPR